MLTPRRFPARAATPEAYDLLVESWTTDAEEPLAGLVPDLESWLDAHRLVQELRCGPIPVIVDVAAPQTQAKDAMSEGDRESPTPSSAGVHHGSGDNVRPRR